jgi:Zn-dependent membrane protease YugP
MADPTSTVVGGNNVGIVSGNTDNENYSNLGGAGSIAGADNAEVQNLTTQGQANVSITGDAVGLGDLAAVAQSVTNAEANTAALSLADTGNISAGVGAAINKQASSPTQQIGDVLLPLAVVAGLCAVAYYLSK